MEGAKKGLSKVLTADSSEQSVKVPMVNQKEVNIKETNKLQVANPKKVNSKEMKKALIADQNIVEKKQADDHDTSPVVEHLEEAEEGRREEEDDPKIKQKIEQAEKLYKESMRHSKFLQKTLDKKTEEIKKLNQVLKQELKEKDKILENMEKESRNGKALQNQLEKKMAEIEKWEKSQKDYRELKEEHLITSKQLKKLSEKHQKVIESLKNKKPCESEVVTKLKEQISLLQSELSTKSNQNKNLSLPQTQLEKQQSIKAKQELDHAKEVQKNVEQRSEKVEKDCQHLKNQVDAMRTQVKITHEDIKRWSKRQPILQQSMKQKLQELVTINSRNEDELLKLRNFKDPELCDKLKKHLLRLQFLLNLNFLDREKSCKMVKKCQEQEQAYILLEEKRLGLEIAYEDCQETKFGLENECAKLMLERDTMEKQLWLALMQLQIKDLVLEGFKKNIDCTRNILRAEFETGVALICKSLNEDKDSDLTRLQEELSSCKEVLASHEDKVKSLTELEEHVDVLRESLKDKEIQLTSSLEKLAEESGKAQKSSQLIESLEKELASLQESLQQKEQRILELEELDKEQITSKLKESEKSLKEMEMKLLSYQDTNEVISTLQHRVSDLSGTLDLKEKRCCELESVCDDLKTKLAKENDGKKLMDEELNALKLSLDERIKVKEVENSNLLSQVDAMKKDIKSKEDIIRAKERAVESIQSRLDDLTADSSKKDINLAQREETILTLRSQLETFKESLSEKQTVENSLDSLKSLNQKLQEELQEKESILMSTEKVVSDLNFKNLELQENVSSLTNEVASLTALLKETQEVSCVANEQNAQVECLKSALTHCEDMIAELNLEKKKLTEENYAKTMLMDEELQALKVSLDEKVKAKEVEISNLLSHVDTMKTEIKLKEDVISAKERAVESIQSRLDDLTADSSKKDINLAQCEETILTLRSQLETFKESLSEKQTVENSLDSSKSLNQKLQEELQEKESILMSTEKVVSDLNFKNLELQENVSSLTNEVTSLTALLKETQEVSCVANEQIAQVERLKSELTNCEGTIAQLNLEKISFEETRKDLISQVQAANKAIDEVVHAKDEVLQREADMKQQIKAAQEALQTKESAVSDLEQELLRLRDGGVNDSTNTEVSSTFSMSRAEEHSRLKDLEDSFEDKYTKLRVVAVKLKRRVSDLTQTLESERTKMAAERTELQGKVNQLTTHAKTIQTLQLEVDRLQDALEEQKEEKLQIKKELDSACRDAAQTKSQLMNVEEALAHLTSEKERLEASKANLEMSLCQTDALKLENEKLTKDLEEKCLLLGHIKEEKRKLSEQLVKARADAKKKGVLSLEMADMEKSVAELTHQLSSERTRLKETEAELDEEHKALSDLREMLKKQGERLLEQERQNSELKEKLLVASKESEDNKAKMEDQLAIVEKLSLQLEEQRAKSEKLSLQCADLAAVQTRNDELSRSQIETLGRQIFQLEEQCSTLHEVKRATEEELKAVRAEFEGYKVRAQSVLRQSTRHEERSSVSNAVHDADELELEVERLRVSVNTLKTSLQQAMTQLQAALQEMNTEKEEKLRVNKTCQSLRESVTQTLDQKNAAEERLRVITEEMKQSKLHADTLILCYKQQLEELKSNHSKKVASLMEQLDNLQASVNNNSSRPIDSQTFVGHSGSSPVADWAANAASAAHADAELALRLSSLHREEGEGSESVESFPSRRISITTQDRRHELIPLDKLLSSSSYPEEDNIAQHARSVEVNPQELQQRLSAFESRTAHLTALLSEAESDAARLSQLNAVLKEEIRRQQRSEERTQHAHNLEYLKNIVVKFITLQSGDERQRLVPVLNTILKLSPEEETMVASVAKGAAQGSMNARSWGSYLPLPGWSGT